MSLNFNDAIAEADIEAACRRSSGGPSVARIILADYRRRGPRLLAASILTFILTEPDADPEIRDRRAVECGADHYVDIRLAAPISGYRLPGADHDWSAEVARSCDWAKLSAEDRSYVLGRLSGEGWQAVATWVELAVGNPDRDGEPNLKTVMRLGCRRYAESRLWLRDHRPEALPLSIYAAAGGPIRPSV